MDERNEDKEDAEILGSALTNGSIQADKDEAAAKRERQGADRDEEMRPTSWHEAIQREQTVNQRELRDRIMDGP